MNDDKVRQLLITTAESVISLSKDGTDVDQALLSLCSEIIARIDLLARVVAIQSERIDKLQERHEALLLGFYSHCQEVLDAKEMN